MIAKERFLDIKKRDLKLITTDDIPTLLEMITYFLKLSPEALQLFDEDLCMVIDIIESDKTYYLALINGKVNIGEGVLEKVNMKLIIDLSTISGIIFGKLEAVISIFTESLKWEGNLNLLLTFFEVFYLALEYFGIISEETMTALIKPSDMRELHDIYFIGPTIIEPHHLFLFISMLTLYANNNNDARDYLSGRDLVILLTIRDVQDMTLIISNDKMSWNRGKPENYTFKIKLNLEKAMEVILNGDAVTSYMAGDIELEGKNAVADGLFFQELIQMYLESFGLRNQ